MDNSKEVGKNSGNDLIFTRRDNGELEYLDSQQLSEMTDQQYFVGLMQNVRDVTWTKITDNVKTAIYMRYKNTSAILNNFLDKQ